MTTPIEHESILESVDYLARVHGFEVTRVPVDGGGRVSAADVAAALRDDTALVSIGYANNEVGTVQDVAAIAAAARERGIPLHLDAVQAAGWLPLSAADLGADAISIAGHKLGAPKGTGVLGVRGRIPLEPLLHGGGQERGRRSGTEDVAGAVGLATALELAEAERVEAAARVSALRDAFVARVLARVPSAALTGDPVHRLPGHRELHVRGHERRGDPARARAPRRRLVERVGVRGRQRRAVPRAGRDGDPAGGRADGRAVHVLARAARAAGCRRRRGRGIRRRRTIGRVSLPRDRAAVTVIVPGFDVAA